MKKIIAPVDFSDASTNALSFAAELSKRASAQLLVVNIFEKGEDEEDSRDKLTTVVSNLKKAFGPNLNCDMLVAHGSLIAELKEIIKAISCTTAYIENNEIHKEYKCVVEFQNYID